jgi:hypothetical protein
LEIRVSAREITIQETRGYRFEAGGVLVFTLSEGLLVGKVKAGGNVRPYAVPCIDVVLKYLENAPKHDIERARKVIEERQ